MKAQLQAIKYGLSMVALGMCVATFGQTPIIDSFSQNGELVCSRLLPGSAATVEWAPSVTGPWTNNWAGLDAVVVNTNGTIRVSVPMFYRVCGVAAPADMALIPAGSFTMGDTFGEGATNELPAHTVQVSAFYMDTNLVSYALWQQVYQWAITNGYSFDNAGSGKAENHPVQTVSWYDAVKWCNARSEMQGLTPCYYTNAAQTVVYRSDQIVLSNSFVKWNCNGFRLPTEAEWEKAARGGVSGQRFPWGNTISHNEANYYAYPLSAGGYAYDLNPVAGYHPAFVGGDYPFTSPADYFAPNGYGLRDMAGNLWECCWDWYDDGWYNNAGATQDDTCGPDSSPAASHVRRGCSWGGNCSFARCACRIPCGPTDAGWDTGFRCVRRF